MAEVVGLASAITAIAATGFKLANTILTIAEELGTVGAQLKAIATDTQAVAWILDELKTRLRNANNITKNALEVVQEIVAQCQVEIDDLNSYMAPLFNREGEDLSLTQRVKWLFAKSKLTTRRVALDSLKLTLSMYICAIRFMDGEDFKECMQDDIKRKVSQSKKTKTAFLDAECLDQTAERAYQIRHGRQELENDGGESVASTADHGQDTDKSDETALTMASREQRGERRWEEKELQAYRAQASDFEIIQTISDDQFVKIGEHIRLHKIVSSFALVVVNQGQGTPASTKGRPSSESNPQPGFEPTHRHVPNSGSLNGATNPSNLPRSRGSNAASPPPAASVRSNTEDDSQSWPSPGSSSLTEDYRGRSPPRTPVGAREHSGRSRRTAQPISSKPDAAPYSPQPREFYDPRYAGTHSSNYPYPHPPQWGYGYQFGAPQEPYTSPAPPSQAEHKPDIEMEKIRAQLAELQAKEDKKKVAMEQAEKEAKIRKDAEDVFARRMEDIRKAQEEAQKQIEKAKEDAERTARERLEAERKADGERRKLHEETMRRVEREVREKIEAEKEQKGLRKYFTVSK